MCVADARTRMVRVVAGDGEGGGIVRAYGQSRGWRRMALERGRANARRGGELARPARNSAHADGAVGGEGCGVGMLACATYSGETCVNGG